MLVLEMVKSNVVQ